MVRRREFIAGLGGAVAWPVAVRAQQRALPVIGVLGGGGRNSPGIGAFLQGLGETGFVEGRNIAIEYRPNNQSDRLQAAAAELVRRQVSVIVTFGGAATLAAKAATTAIPVVFVVGVDPVRNGLVASLNRPGGNLTGVTNLGIELGPKRLELLHELVPTASLIGALVDTNRPTFESETSDLEAAARKLGKSGGQANQATTPSVYLRLGTSTYNFSRPGMRSNSCAKRCRQNLT